jgi:thiol-disulfide isomerase/thioredoxin
MRAVVRLLPVLAALVLSAGCAGKDAVDTSGGSLRYVAGSGAVVRYSEPKAAPPLSGRTLDGSTFTLRPGQVTVVNFWASWCPPCRDEADGLAQVARESRVRFVGVAFKDDLTNAKAFVTRHRTPYPSVLDRYSRIAARWRVPNPPSTYVLDRRGRIVASVYGAVSYSTLKPLVQAATR